MDLKSSFFGHSSEREKQNNSALVIQTWWKKIRLNQILQETGQYTNQVLSLHQAKNMTFRELSVFITQDNTLRKTHEVLNNLEKLKKFFLPSRFQYPQVSAPEHLFLSAYLITSKSDHLFSSPDEVDERILTQSKEMIKTFEQLCKNINTISFNDSNEMDADDKIKSELKENLEKFNQIQMSFYEMYPKWNANNDLKLVSTLIKCYVELEVKRAVIFMDPDPRMLELYEGYGNQQATLEKRIENLLGNDGLQMLEEHLDQLKYLEEAKWLSVPEEVLVHELTLNPEFELSPEIYDIEPINNIDAAIAALTQQPANKEPIADVLEEIGTRLSRFTPHNKKINELLYQEFNKKALIHQIETLGLETAVCNSIYSVIEKIKHLESLAHIDETVAFQNQLNYLLGNKSDTSIILKQSLAFIYFKFSQINQECHLFQINNIKKAPLAQRVEYEKQAFQNRLTGSQFNLAAVLSWIDKCVDSPANYKLNTASLCSKYTASYIAPAIIINILEKPGEFDLRSVPETFYLDRARLADWHADYQKLFYTLAGIGFLKTFCLKYGVKLTPEASLEQKKRLIFILEEGKLSDPQSIATHITSMFHTLLLRNNKHLNRSDEMAFTKILQDICTGENRAAKLINQRLSDYLSCYLFKGYLPESATHKAQLHGLQTELSQLGDEIRLMLRLHIKVHGNFYRQQIEERLWKPLFTMLSNSQTPTELPALLSSQQKPINNLHARIHKMTFLLYGLSLIQQKVVYEDMWNLQAGMKYDHLKKLAHSFKLIDMTKDPDASKDKIEKILMQMMKQVALEQKLTFESNDQNDMARMFRLAKNGQSPGYKAFAKELTATCQQFVIKAKKPANTNHLISEFKEDLDELCAEAKEIIAKVKQDQIPEDIDPVIENVPKLQTGTRPRPF